MRFGQIVGWTSHAGLEGRWNDGWWFHHSASVPGSVPLTLPPGGLFSRLALELPLVMARFGALGGSDWLPRRTLASNSPLAVPDRALLVVPTGFQGASWPPTPPCQYLIWRSWPFRLAAKAHLGLKRPFCWYPFAGKTTLWRRSVVACAIFGQQANNILRPDSFSQRGGCAKHHEYSNIVI